MWELWTTLMGSPIGWLKKITLRWSWHAVWKPFWSDHALVAESKSEKHNAKFSAVWGGSMRVFLVYWSVLQNHQYPPTYQKSALEIMVYRAPGRVHGIEGCGGCGLWVGNVPLHATAALHLGEASKWTSNVWLTIFVSQPTARNMD